MMERMSFVSSLFRSMKNLYKEVKQMQDERYNETTRGFQEEGSPCTSYSQKEEPVLQRNSNKYTMPFLSEEEYKKHGEGVHLEHEILSGYLAEYKSQRRAFKETLTLPQFIQLGGERRPCSNRKMRGNKFLLSTFYGLSTSTTRAWVMKLDAFFLLHPVVEREIVAIQDVGRNPCSHTRCSQATPRYA